MITKDFWRSLFWINVAVIGVWWWLSNRSAFGQGGYVSLIALGRLSGLLAAGAVLLQFTLMGRLPWLERSFGLDQQTGRVAMPYLTKLRGVELPEKLQNKIRLKQYIYKCERDVVVVIDQNGFRFDHPDSHPQGEV